MVREFGDAIWALETGPLYYFRDWPSGEVPKYAAGVYTIWREAEFVYVGMAGRGKSAEQIAERRNRGSAPTGLLDRIGSHASGRRSGDQFCFYVADRFVLPLLDQDTIASIADGSALFDHFVRRYVHEHLAYRFAVVEDGASAARLERLIVSDGLTCGPPILNSA